MATEELASGPGVLWLKDFRPPGQLMPGQFLTFVFVMNDIGLFFLRFTRLADIIALLINVLPLGLQVDVDIRGDALIVVVANPREGAAASTGGPAVVVVISLAAIISAVGTALAVLILAFTVHTLVSKTTEPGGILGEGGGVDNLLKAAGYGILAAGVSVGIIVAIQAGRKRQIAA